jgi:hypothetical protein
MTRDEFDSHAPPAELFTLTPENVPAVDDGCGTGDLLALLRGSPDDPGEDV